MKRFTLKFNLALTLSANTSVIDLSKAEMTFMAVWGSRRPEWTRSSRVSMRDMPILNRGGGEVICNAGGGVGPKCGFLELPHLQPLPAQVNYHDCAVVVRNMCLPAPSIELIVRAAGIHLVGGDAQSSMCV